MCSGCLVFWSCLSPVVNSIGCILVYVAGEVKGVLEKMSMVEIITKGGCVVIMVINVISGLIMRVRHVGT